MSQKDYDKAAVYLQIFKSTAPSEIRVYMGLRLHDICIYTLQFSDKQVVIANDKEGTEYLVRKLIEEYQDLSLSISNEKTKYLCIGANSNNICLEYRLCMDHIEIS